MAVCQTADSVVSVMTMTMMMVHVSTRSPCSSSSSQKRGMCFKKRRRTVAQTSSSFLDKYDLILNQSPLLVKSLTSFVGFGIADIVAQGLTLVGAGGRGDKEGSRGSFVAARTLRFAAFGFLLYGPASSTWYSLLDTFIFIENPTSGIAVATKVFADQIFWAPCLISMLFAFDLAFDASETKPSLTKKIENDLFSALKVNWSFWPLFHFFSFKFVSTEDRILYINCVQVLFNVFLVYTSSKREKNEKNK